MQTYEYLSLRVTDEHFNTYSQATFPLAYHCRYSTQIHVKVSPIGRFVRWNYTDSYCVTLKIPFMQKNTEAIRVS